MSTTMKRIFAKACGPILLLTACMTLSSCIIADPYHHHHRHYHDWDGRGYHQEVRP